MEKITSAQHHTEGKTYFRTKRVFYQASMMGANAGWYFMLREGVCYGPFDKEETAARMLAGALQKARQGTHAEHHTAPQDQIVRKIVAFLDRQLANDAGDIAREPHKGELFALFRQAYTQGWCHPSATPVTLSGNYLRGALLARWIRDDHRRLRLLDGVCSWWNEWIYACDNLNR